MEQPTERGGVVHSQAAIARTKIQQTYRAWLQHSQECADCETNTGRCETSVELWQAYREARIS